MQIVKKAGMITSLGLQQFFNKQAIMMWPHLYNSNRQWEDITWPRLQNNSWLVENKETLK